MSNWTLIESDPGVFTELIEMLGVKGIQMEELYSLDKSIVDRYGSIYGLIFLFKWQQEKDDRTTVDNKDLFFARQVVTNACATQALLSILMNITDEKVKLGKDLEEFKEFTKDFNPEMKGVTIGSSEVIRNAHNSFSSPNPFAMESGSTATKDDDVFHFIAYIPFNGHIYEMDGLKRGPIQLEIGSVTQDNFVDKVIPHIEKRISKYAKNEIKFNLMAMIRDQREVLNEKIQQNKDQNLPTTELENRLNQENYKRSSWKEENQRRRHNYVPFLMTLLKVLSEEGKLQDMVAKAQK